MNHTAVAPRIVEYPSSDGQPMAETPVHRDAMIDAIQRPQEALRQALGGVREREHA